MKHSNNFFRRLSVPAVAVFLCAFCASPSSAREERKHAAGFITDSEGECWLINQAGERSGVKLGMFVYERDTLKTGRRAGIKVIFSNGVEARIRQNSELSIMEVPPAERGMSSRVKMVVGGVFSRVVKQKTKFNVHTPVVTIAVRGTEFDTDVAAGGGTEVRVFKGAVGLENDFGKSELKENMKSVVTPGAPPSPPEPMTASEKKTAEESRAAQAESYALRFELRTLEPAEDDIVPSLVSVRDGDGFEVKGFRNKITLNAAGGVLLSRPGAGRWTSSLDGAAGSDGSFRFDVKAVSGGPAQIVAAAKNAEPAIIELKISRPRERTLRLNIKDGPSEREIKIKLKSK